MFTSSMYDVFLIFVDISVFSPKGLCFVAVTSLPVGQTGHRQTGHRHSLDNNNGLWKCNTTFSTES